ncbi:hypothetical protein ACGFX4_33885 [Kitasatospora sp. NPDC048365]|uniref:WXG100-like domain-containing protein n=1 Tax=Kitasatospora sp. NPDC048365 TaxID=3364050 RepID=UPI003712EC8D
MAIELPSELSFVLNLLGIKWPQANEDELIKLADQLKKLATQIDSTQMAADKAITTLGEYYHGDAADKLAEVWSGISKFSGIIVDACETASKVLQGAALVIEVCKGQCIVQLVNIQAQLAASSATFGLSTGAIIALGREIISRILDEAVSRLAKMIAEPVADLAEKAVKEVLGTPPGKSNGQSFGIDLARMTATAVELRRHGDDIDSHGSSFRKIVDSLDIGNPSEMFGKIAVEAAEQIARAVGVEIINRLLNHFRDTAGKMDTIVRNLSDHEDSQRHAIGALGSQQASPLSPLQLAGGAGGALGGGHSGDAGLSAFDSLRPHLAGGGSGGVGGHGGSGTSVLGGINLSPHLGGHGGGSGGGGGGTDGPDRVAGALPHQGQGLRLGAGTGRRGGGGGTQTDLEAGTGGPHGSSAGGGTNGVVGAGANGSGSGNGSGNGARGMAAPPPGMMGGHYGPVGGGSSGNGNVRSAVAQQRGNRRPEDDEEDETRRTVPIVEDLDDAVETHHQLGPVHIFTPTD